jgi:N-acetylmuramoyl-L-alanine amidase
MKREQKITFGERQGLRSSASKVASSGFAVRPRRVTIIAAIAALLLLPIEASEAGWLSDIFQGP